MAPQSSHIGVSVTEIKGKGQGEFANKHWYTHLTKVWNDRPQAAWGKLGELMNRSYDDKLMTQQMKNLLCTYGVPWAKAGADKATAEREGSNGSIGNGGQPRRWSTGMWAWSTNW